MRNLKENAGKSGAVSEVSEIFPYLLTGKPEKGPAIRERTSIMASSMYVENKALDALFEELVPSYGMAETMAGEIVRATTRIGHRWNNDGDMIGYCYGRETCNPPARFLLNNTNERIADIITELWELGQWTEEGAYAEALRELCAAVVEFVEGNSDLRKAYAIDMYSYTDDAEDDAALDDEDEDDEDEDDEDDGWYW